MAGRLISKGPDKWELVVDVGRDPLDHTRRQRRSRTVYGSKRQATKQLAAFVTKLADARPTADVRFGTVLTAWLEQAELSPTTRREYTRLVERRIRPALGATPIRKLDAGQLDRFYRALLTDLLPSSIRQIHAIIRRSLAQAVKWGWLDRNVAANASPPKVHQPKPRPPTFRAVEALIEAAEAKDAHLGLAIHLAAATGARRGELCAIRWSDVDLDQGTICIRRSVWRTGGGQGEKATKTHAERTVDIGASTTAALKGRRQAQEESAAAAEATLGPHAFVLSREADGSEPLNPDQLTGAWRRLPGTTGIRLHDLRHWSITEALDQGHNIVAVAERHGHKSAKMTLDVYGGTADGRGKKIAAGIDDVLAGERRARALGPPG
jgi:integrase